MSFMLSVCLSPFHWLSHKQRTAFFQPPSRFVIFPEDGVLDKCHHGGYECCYPEWNLDPIAILAHMLICRVLPFCEQTGVEHSDKTTSSVKE